MSEKNKAIMREMAEVVFNSQDLTVLDRYVAADFVELDPFPGQGPGRDGLKQVLAQFFTAFPDLRWTVLEQVAEDDKVVSRGEWTGTHRGDFAGVVPTGRRITVGVITIDRLRDGVMVESRLAMDDLGMLRQMGVLPDLAAS